MKFNQIILFISFLGFSLVTWQCKEKKVYGYLTDDGAWCWFSDPRAIVIDDVIVTGWVKTDGTVEAGKLRLSDLDIQYSNLYPALEKDDHNNPAFALTNDVKILAMYSTHSKKELYSNVWYMGNEDFSFSDPLLLDPLDSLELIKYPRETVTYANPYGLSEENNKLYCFGRWTGFKPNFMISEDNGNTWSKSKVFITNYPFDANNRPYVKYYSDGKSKIHMVFTDGHPRVEPENSVYYAYLENGRFYRANGSEIVSMENIPFEPKESSVIFRSDSISGRAWIADIAQDKKGNPVILYTRSPTENDHEYWYAHYMDDHWEDHKICSSGPWFPNTSEGKKEREPHYFGGLTLHPEKPNILYLSRKINGVFEIERWVTDDSGKTWKNEAITSSSTLDNVRPYIPRGLEGTQKEIVLWMENRSYIHYTDFDSAIRYCIRGN